MLLFSLFLKHFVSFGFADSLLALIVVDGQRRLCVSFFYSVICAKMRVKASLIW
jgi:hypothetical protein